MLLNHFRKRSTYKISALITPVLIVSFLLGACSFGAGTPDISQIETAAAGTIVAGGAPGTIEAQSALLTSQVAELQSTQLALAGTQTALAPGGSPTAASASTAPAGTQAAQTPAPGAGGPTVSVSADTNCRQGPGTDYPIVSMLRVGATTAVQGKDASGSWYYVANPGGGSGSCWLWNQFATVQGNSAALEVVNAPPPPAPVATQTGQPSATSQSGTTTSQPGSAAANVSFANVHRCGGVVVAILVENTGSVAFRSARVTVREPVTGQVLGQYSSDVAFMSGDNACPPGRGSLAPGETAYVIGSVDEALPAGAAGRATVALCTDNNLDGDCEEIRLDFTFPDV